MHISIAKIDFRKFNKTKIDIAKIDFAKKGEGPVPPKPITSGLKFWVEPGKDATISYQFNEYYQEHNKYLKYSYDGLNWTNWTEEIQIVGGEEVIYVKGEDNYVRKDKTKWNSFFNISAYGPTVYSDGNIMSLVNFNSEITVPYCFYYLFGQEGYLKTAPELPAETLAEGCYSNMFEGCSALKAAPALPATTLTKNCYHNMFSACVKLTAAPILPATTLADYCYSGMFNDCEALTTAPILPATELADHCYSYMFSDCVTLATAPALPATTLADYCYEYMFSACTALTTAPILPATTLAEGCYSGMFNECAIVEAPELYVSDLVTDCYGYMFSASRSLNWIKSMNNTAPSTSYTSGWVSGVASSGVFVMSPTASWDESDHRGINGIPTNWKVIYYFIEEDKYYLDRNKETECDKYGNTMTDTMYFKLADGEESGNISYQFDEYYEEFFKYLKYSTDGNNWTDWTETITMSPNTKYYVIGEGNYVRNSNNNTTGFFSTVGRVECGGNIMSLISEEDEYEIKTGYCFSRLFRSSSIISAPKMTATKISGTYCCQYMFQNCTSLTEAPELPATDIANRCYYYMFAGCSNLTKAPSILPATTVGTYCYAYMFQNCTSLTEAPSEISSNTISNYGCSYMFAGCTSLTKAPELPAKTVVAQGCGHMFDGCTSLTEAPELPATNIGTYCYTYMFRNCTNLTKAPSILPAKSYQNYCYSFMFNNCQKLVEAPELPATGLVGGYCMRDMFGSCYKLNWIKALFISMSATTYTSGWVQGVSAQGVFVKNIKATWETTGANGVPSTWKIIYFDTTEGKYYTTKTKETECDKYGNPLGERMRLFTKKPTDVGIYWDPDYVELPEDSDSDYYDSDYNSD